MNNRIIVGAAVVALLVTGAWAYTNANGSVITACVGKNGEVYVVGQGFKRTECSKTETPLSWNTQGSAGPQGPAGPQGVPGTPGTNGAPGQNLHLFDANGQDLGIFLGRTQYGDYQVFLPNAGVTVNITTQDDQQKVTLHPAEGGASSYTTADCSGTAYTTSGGDLNVLSEVVPSSSGTHYYTPIAQARVSETIASYTDDSGNCRIPAAPNVSQVIPLKEISMPFTEPIAWPLHIQAE
jgi:hypothetical protein